MYVTNMEVRGQSRVDLTKTCSLVGRVTRLTNNQADGGLDGSGDEKFDVRDVHTFLGIPYAKPPVGDLMFKDPEPVELWQGEKQAAEFGPACPQNLDILEFESIKLPPPAKVGEDCLHLNVWSPNTSHDAGLPVMVWFYGGAFMFGYTDIYRGDVLVNFHDVVVVTVSYRVGVWGFLCTGDSAATGNFGLLDQVEALRWVKKYIKNFGGDPNNVTIFGESAGGASVAYHMVSPISRGLFKNAISQSGTVLTMGDTKTPAERAKSLKVYLKYIGCESTNGEEIVTFIRSQPSEKLIVPLEMRDYLFLPVMDGQFLTEKVSECLECGKLNAGNYLMGVNRDEGAFLIPMFFPTFQDGTPLSVSKEEAGQILAGSLATSFFGRCDINVLLASVMKEYFNDVTSGDDVVKALVEVLGDVIFVAHAIRTANAHAEKSDVYFYSFEKRNAFVKYPDFIKSDHASEIPSVFGLPYLFPHLEFTAEDRALCRKMMTYWTNFAKTGNPNGAGLPDWPEYRKGEGRYLVLGDSIIQSSNLKANRIKFWNETVMKLQR